jgi:hypothetical protein
MVDTKSVFRLKTVLYPVSAFLIVWLVQKFALILHPFLLGRRYAPKKTNTKKPTQPPSPSPIGCIRVECGSRARIVCKIWLQRKELNISSMFNGGGGVGAVALNVTKTLLLTTQSN